MRTTVRLDPDLIARAKEVAAETGTTVTAVIEEALRARLEKKRVVRIPTFHGTGLQPGVDLNNSAALLELMEEERDTDRRQRAGERVSRRRG
jgi:hypothetical protein